MGRIIKGESSGRNITTKVWSGRGPHVLGRDHKMKAAKLRRIVSILAVFLLQLGVNFSP